MAEHLVRDEDLIAWIDGELSSASTAKVAEAVEQDPSLAARAVAHRRLAERMALAFGSIAHERVALARKVPAAVISFAAVRDTRAEEARRAHRWMIPGAIAASLLVGVLVGEQAAMVAGVDDRSGALALAKPVVRALDNQLSGEASPIRVSLSFRSKDSGYCRSFADQHIDGVACHAATGWQLRYAEPMRTDLGKGYPNGW